MGNCFSVPSAAPRPAAPPVQNAISQGLGDAQQVLGLFDGIYKYVEPSVLEARNKRDETKALKSFIGPWWNETFAYGACMVPVLDIENFEKHLQQTQCRLQPRGNCTAGAPWANLLHALAINPDDQILTWKKVSGLRWEMPQGTLAMDVRGVAFCHLVNLYKIEDPSDEGFLVEGERQERGRCRLSFGWLTWTSTDAGHMIAQFESDTIPKINALKVPFGEEDPLSMLGQGTETLWKLYKTALKQDISDDSLVWPNPNATPLSERLICLREYFYRISGRRSMLILTKAWLEQATRIRFRATTNGGTDDTFKKNAFDTLAQHPDRPKLDIFDYAYLGQELKECFFDEGDQFTFRQTSRTTVYKSRPQKPVLTAQKILNLTLESYNAEPLTSWKGKLYRAREDLVTVAAMPRVLDVDFTYVRVLEFSPKDPLWNARVHLSTPKD